MGVVQLYEVGILVVGHCFFKHYAITAIPFIAVFFCARSLYSLAPKATGKLTVSAIEAAGAAEAVWWLCCHGYGSFGLSGPFGCFAAVALCVAAGHLWEERSVAVDLFHRQKTSFIDLLRYCIAAVCAVLSLVALPVLLSRTAWAAAGVTLLALCLKEKILRPGKAGVAIMLAVLLLAGAGAVVLKKDSALGRLHIWRIECRAIMQKPLGVGPGNELWQYGCTQEEFFHSKERPQAIVRVAGNPEHAFNEYLKFGMQGGVLGLLASVAAVVLSLLSLRRRSLPLWSGMMAFAIVAVASYPLAFTMFQIMLALLLAAASVPEGTPTAAGAAVPVSHKRNIPGLLLAGASLVALLASSGYRSSERKALVEVRGKHTVEELAPYREQLPWFYPYMYELGLAMYKEGRYEECLEVMEKASRLTADPLPHNISGLCYKELGGFKEATHEFLRAHYMVPFRLLPLYNLMLLMEETGHEAEALGLARTIATAPVNRNNKQMVQIQAEARGAVEYLTQKNILND